MASTKNYIYDNATFIQGQPVAQTPLTTGQAYVINAAGQLVPADPGAQLNYPSNVPIGSVAYGSMGSDTVNVAGTIYCSEFELTHHKTIKGLALLNGSTAATDKNIVALYSKTGVLLASSALAGAVASGTDAFQAQDFTATYEALPGRYLVAYQCNGTTTKVRKNAASTFLNWTISQTGAFGTLPTLTAVPTTIVTAAGGFFYAYS